MRAQHDALAQDVLAHLLEDEGSVEKEKVVAPKDSQRIDLVFKPDPNKRKGGKRGPTSLRLIRRMTRRWCMFELFSAVPSAIVVLLSLRKQISVLDEMLVAARRKGKAGPRPGMPVQWILSPGRPTRALQKLGFQPARGWPRGFYHAAEGFQAWIVVISELPKTLETLALRLLGNGCTRLEALGEIGAMPTDDKERPLLLALLGWIEYVIGENRKVAERLRKEPEFMAATREGFEQWMKKKQQLAAAKVVREARSEGKAEGKAESLLRILTARHIAVSKKLREQIVKCSDEKKLDRWIERSVTAGSADELLQVS